MPSPSPINPKPEPWYRHRWPWLLMAGPVSVLIAGAITMWISFSGADALVVDDYYKQGKAINQDLRREREAAALGISLMLSFDAASGQLHGQVHGLTSRSVLRLSLIHPTMPEKDWQLSAMPDVQGQFAVALPMMERARWQVQLEDAERHWRLRGSWAWPQQRHTSIRAVSDRDQRAEGGG